MSYRVLAVCLIVAACGCGQSRTDDGAEVESQAGAGAVAAEAGTTETPAVIADPRRNAYFGDTHIHTVLSFDAFLMGTRRTPDDAYEFAKGAAIEHASGFRMQMKKPIDFLAVSDHGFYLGMMRELANPQSAYGYHRLSEAVRNATTAAGSANKTPGLPATSHTFAPEMAAG